jgi:hypothetical protein
VLSICLRELQQHLQRLQVLQEAQAGCGVLDLCRGGGAVRELISPAACVHGRWTLDPGMQGAS